MLLVEAGFDAGLNDSLMTSITGKSSIDRNCSVATSPDPYFSSNKPDKNALTFPVVTNGSAGLLAAVSSDVGFDWFYSSSCLNCLVHSSHDGFNCWKVF